MRSLPILFWLCVMGLARNEDLCGSDSVSILGKELKSMLMRPEYKPYRVTSPYKWHDICEVLVTFTNNRVQTVMVVGPTKNKVLTLDVCIESSEQKINFTLNPTGVLTKRKNTLPHDDKVDNNEVDDDEVFHVLGKTPDPHKMELESSPYKIQHVTYTEFYVEPLTQLLNTVAEKCSMYCASSEITSTKSLTLYVTTERPLQYVMRLGCDTETVDLLSQDKNNVKIFNGGTGTNDKPLSYNWKNQTYLNNIMNINSTRWVSLQYDAVYRASYITQPLNFAHSKGVKIPLRELLVDLTVICRLMWDSPNFPHNMSIKRRKGIVALDDKVIARLSRSKPAGSQVCLIKFKEMSPNLLEQRDNKKIVLRHDSSYRTGPTASRIMIPDEYITKLHKVLMFTTYCCVIQYISLRTIKLLVLHLSDNSSTFIDKSNPNEDLSRFSVDFVYNTHYVLRTNFSSRGVACSNGLEVVRAYDESNFPKVTEKTNVKLVCFAPILDGIALITPDSPLNDDFAVKLEDYRPLQKDTSRYEYLEMEIPFSEKWKAYIQFPKEKLYISEKQTKRSFCLN